LEGDSSRALALLLAREAVDLKAEEVRILEVRDLLFITDYFVLATTGSARQTRALAEALNQALRQAGRPKGTLEGSHRSPWLLMDCGSVVVHILTAEAREFYGLDEHWADAPEIDLEGNPVRRAG